MFVNEDLAGEILQRRKDQLPKLKQAKQAGKIAYFVSDKLIIKDRPSIYLNSDKLTPYSILC